MNDIKIQNYNPVKNNKALQSNNKDCTIGCYNDELFKCAVYDIEDGIKVVGPNEKKEVKIYGDKIGQKPFYSFVEGLAKGLAVSTLGINYPFLISLFKTAEGFYKTNSAIKEVKLDKCENMKDLKEWKNFKISLKGAKIGLLNGFMHSILDYVAIGAVAFGGGLLGGPLGATIAGTIGGGIYNVLKDAVRINDNITIKY